MYIQTVDGLYLTSASTGGLSLEKEPADDDLSLWELKYAPGGWNIVNAGEGIQAMEYYSGRFTTYKLSTSGSFVFNFYQIL